MQQEKPSKRPYVRSPDKRTRVVTLLAEEKLQELLGVVHACTALDGNGCAVVDVRRSPRLSRNQKGYVQIKVKDPKDRRDPAPPNQKVQLHQLIAWTHPDEAARAALRSAIEGKQLEISHLCENKACATYSHLCAEDSWTNKTRLTCEVVVYVGGVEYCICRHQPPCILTKDKQARAFKFEVRAEGGGA